MIALRKSKNLSSERFSYELSDIVGVTIARSTVSAWEYGTNEMPLWILDKLTTHYGITMDAFYKTEIKFYNP